MEYFVQGSDGQEYGPASVDVLKSWVADSRLTADTMLRPASGGAWMAASLIPGLFAAAPALAAAPPVAATPPANYPRPNYQTPDYSQAPQYVPAGNDHSMGIIWGVLIRSILAVVVFFFLHGFGIIFAGYAMYYAFQAKQSGHKYGTIALVIAGIALAIVIGGWALRGSGANV